MFRPDTKYLLAVVTCIGRARYFGDINDRKGLVLELIAKYKATRLKYLGFNLVSRQIFMYYGQLRMER